jgi:hypothetical protein
MRRVRKRATVKGRKAKGKRCENGKWKVENGDCGTINPFPPSPYIIGTENRMFLLTFGSERARQEERE